MSETQQYDAAPEEGQAGRPGTDARQRPPSPQSEAAYVRAQRTSGDFDPHFKGPRQAVFLSLIFPGLGQIYVGYYKRGLAVAASLWLLFMVAMEAGDDIGPPIAWAIAFGWMFSVIDAGRMAALYNHAVAGGERIELPQDIKMPQLGGSIVAGAVLMTFGGIALSNTLLDIRLDWLEDWWPVFPFGLGIYLLARGIMDHMNSTSSTSRHADAGDTMDRVAAAEGE